MHILIFISILSVILSIYLFIKLSTIKKNIDNINKDIQRILSTETNNLLTLSTNDKTMKNLVINLNKHLVNLRKQQLLYINGNLEVRNKIAHISHDIRTPLTAICGYLDLLKSKEKNTEVERYICIIEERIEKLKQLTDEFFDYSLIEIADNIEVQKKVVINELLEESILDFYGVFKERNIIPLINLTDKKIIRELNPRLLSRVFSNLLSNALKYSDGDLQITLKESGEIIFINTAKRLDVVQVEQLFNRFYTVENAKYSTGLGLEITKNLVNQMNGSISANLKNGQLILIILL